MLVHVKRFALMRLSVKRYGVLLATLAQVTVHVKRKALKLLCTRHTASDKRYGALQATLAQATAHVKRKALKRHTLMQGALQTTHCKRQTLRCIASDIRSSDRFCFFVCVLLLLSLIHISEPTRPY